MSTKVCASPVCSLPAYGKGKYCKFHKGFSRANYKAYCASGTTMSYREFSANNAAFIEGMNTPAPTAPASKTASTPKAKVTKSPSRSARRAAHSREAQASRMRATLPQPKVEKVTPKITVHRFNDAGKLEPIGDYETVLQESADRFMTEIEQYMRKGYVPADRRKALLEVLSAAMKSPVG